MCKKSGFGVFALLLVAGVMSLAPSVFAQANVPSSALQPAKVAVDEVPEAARVFGQHLFAGAFGNQSFTGFSPDYQIAMGDTITLSMWGGFEFTGELAVDAQGNIFVPQVGPIKLLGVRNEDLNSVVLDAVTQVYKRNVGVYASLDGAQPVQVLVTGFVTKAGVYAGHASDSLLYFLDQAGGIDNRRGSYRTIRLIRQGREIALIDLYDFILEGKLPLFQIRNGDTILVEPLASQVSVAGDTRNAFRFEFEGDISVKDLMALAAPEASATHIRIERNSLVQDEVDYIKLTDADAVLVRNGDRVFVTTDKLPGTISVRVEGEHNSQQEFVLPYGATLQDLLTNVDFGVDAERSSIQLLRRSVKARQKEMLDAQLRALENSVLTARSRSTGEAQLRQTEAQLILQWLDRARQIEPKGQVTLAKASNYSDYRLEQGDIIRIPRKSNLLMIHGDVLFPNAVAFQDKTSVEDYIDQAGGLNQAKTSVRILVLHRDGTFIKVSRRLFRDRDIDLRPGDEIFVLPRVEAKRFQFAREIIEVFYQLALSAGVVLRL